jgi:hypothetical protein
MKRYYTARTQDIISHLTIPLGSASRYYHSILLPYHNGYYPTTPYTSHHMLQFYFKLLYFTVSYKDNPPYDAAQFQPEIMLPFYSKRLDTSSQLYTISNNSISQLHYKKLD